MTPPTEWQGDRYDPALSHADIAAILRRELKKQFPDFSFSVTKDITVTVAGRGVRGDADELTPLGKQIKEEVGPFFNRWRFYHDPDRLSDYCHSNSFLTVNIKEKLARADISAEMERLKQEYWITDWATLQETMFAVSASPLTSAAIHRLYVEFKPKKPRPELNHAVTAEFAKWVEKVKEWIADAAVQYDRGPKFWKVMLGKRVLCVVDGTNGTIYKASYNAPQKDSPRGTIFDGVNVFTKRRLLAKREYDWMSRFCSSVGKTFPSFVATWEYAKAQRKLRQLLEREPTPEEIELVVEESVG